VLLCGVTLILFAEDDPLGIGMFRNVQCHTVI
jgi:hypothetical protein